MRADGTDAGIYGGDGTRVPLSTGLPARRRCGTPLALRAAYSFLRDESSGHSGPVGDHQEQDGDVLAVHETVSVSKRVKETTCAWCGEPVVYAGIGRPHSHSPSYSGSRGGTIPAAEAGCHPALTRTSFSS